MTYKAISSKIKSIIFLTLFISLMASTSIAATYFVDKNNNNASDSNPGTESSPFKTFMKGVKTAYAGDTVYVKAGTYYEYVVGERSGTSGQPITFKNFENDVVSIDGSNHQQYKAVDFYKRDYIVWDGIDVRNSYRTGLWFSYANHVIIQNSKIYNIGTANRTGDTGITIFFGDSNIVRNNEVYNCGWNGMNLQSLTNTTVEKNYVHDNDYHAGIQLFHEVGSPSKMWTNNNMRYNTLDNNDTGIYLRYQEYNEVSNNLVINSNKWAIYVHSEVETAGTLRTYQGHTKINNNTIAGNGKGGILNESATHLVIKNNIISNHASSAIQDNKRSNNHIIDHNLYYQNASIGPEASALSGNPLFKDVTNKDYSLKQGSPAIDAGADLSSDGPAQDLEGTPRPIDAKFDIGAYEYGTSTVQISPPVGVRIVLIP